MCLYSELDVYQKKVFYKSIVKEEQDRKLLILDLCIWNDPRIFCESLKSIHILIKFYLENHNEKVLTVHRDHKDNYRHQ